jgi:penicillin-binding protein 1A
VAITKIFDAKNNNIYTNVFEGQDVANPAATYVLINLMKGVMESGTGRAANIDRPCAGKTGTTNDYVDAWFCGITPNLVCCLYVGNDDRVPLGPRASAGAVAAPIWKAFMEKSLAGTPVVDFRQPEGVVWKTICLDSGHLADEKCIRKADIPFIAGKEAVEICAAHNENGLAENEDGSILLTPTKVIRRTILSPTDSSIPESDDFRSPNNRRNEEEKPIFERRSKFQNRHDSPFNN